MVDADTLVCVFNPNVKPVFTRITVFDKYGNVVADEQPPQDAGVPIDVIPPMGMAWITLGMLLDEGTYLGKYSFVITWVRPPFLIPYRGLVAEVKQIIYNSPQPLEPDNPCWNPAAIKAWSETALGKGKGRHGGGVGYSR